MEPVRRRGSPLSMGAEELAPAQVFSVLAALKPLALRVTREYAKSAGENVFEHEFALLVCCRVYWCARLCLTIRARNLMQAYLRTPQRPPGHRVDNDSLDIGRGNWSNRAGI